MDNFYRLDNGIVYDIMYKYDDQDNAVLIKGKIFVMSEMDSKKFWKWFWRLVLAFVIGFVLIALSTGCASAADGANGKYGWKNSPNIAMGASQLPPTVPYQYRYKSNLDGSKVSWKERGTYQSVSQYYTWTPSGVGVSNSVWSYNYTNSGSYQGRRYYYPGMVDDPNGPKYRYIEFPRR
jgi:hypothetical protein